MHGFLTRAGRSPRSENFTEREKDQAVAIGEALEPLERQAARERQATLNHKEFASVKFTEAKGQALDKVAAVVGMSRQRPVSFPRALGDNPVEICKFANFHIVPTAQGDNYRCANLHIENQPRASRRHLNESQRAVIAARLANMRQGERTDLVPIGTRLSLEQAAELLNVGRAMIAAKLANMPLGGTVYRSEKLQTKNGGSIDPPKISLEQATELLNVGDAQAWTENRQDKRCKFACLEARRRRRIAQRWPCHHRSETGEYATAREQT